MTSQSTLGLRADLNPPQINTMGCQPSGPCHRLHPLKPRPDPGRACVTAPALSTIWTRHPMLSRLLPSLLRTHHTRRWFSPSDIHGSALFHSQIPGSGSHALIEIINTSDQGRLRFGCVSVAPVFYPLIKAVCLNRFFTELVLTRTLNRSPKPSGINSFVKHCSRQRQSTASLFFCDV